MKMISLLRAYSLIWMLPWIFESTHNKGNVIMDEAGLVKTMKEKAQAVQSRVVEVQNMEAALSYAVELTLEQNGTLLAAPGLAKDDPAAAGLLAELCRTRGITLVTENLREHIGTIQTGFTKAEYGIAETGTLVQVSDSEDIRVATMLSETHVAVIPRTRLRADTLAFEPEMLELLRAAPGYVAFISGASRTADIERVLTIGVHGPGELHILLLEENAS